MPEAIKPLRDAGNAQLRAAYGGWDMQKAIDWLSFWRELAELQEKVFKTTGES